MVVDVVGDDYDVVVEAVVEAVAVVGLVDCYLSR